MQYEWRTDLAFPANLIGLTAGVAAGAYAGYEYAQPGGWTVTESVIIFLLLGLGFFFAVILS